jgi:hypothetical protein
MLRALEPTYVVWRRQENPHADWIMFIAVPVEKADGGSIIIKHAGEVR